MTHDEFHHSTPPPPLAYRVSAVAEMLGVSRPTVHGWIKRGYLASVRIGKITFVPRAAFDALFDGGSK